MFSFPFLQFKYLSIVVNKIFQTKSFVEMPLVLFTEAANFQRLKYIKKETIKKNAVFD